MNKEIIKLHFLYLFLLLLGLSSCSEKEKRRILVIHSYEKDYAAYPDFNQMIADRFQKESVNSDIRTLYLDCEAFMEKPELERMLSLLDSVSRDWRPELILVNEDQATYSLLKCGFPLVKEVPIVFAGVNYPNRKLLEQYPNATGLHDKIGFRENIDMAKQLFGDKIHLFTILDSTYLDKQIRADAKKQLIGYKVVGFMDSQEKSLPEQFRLWREEGYTRFIGMNTRTGTKRLPYNLMWALSKSHRDQCYIQLKRDFTTINIGNINTGPSLTAINEAFEYGENILGGYLTTMSDQIEEEVSVAIRILRGKSPSEIPVTESRKRYVVDWNMMQRLDMTKDQVPSHYTILHIPFSGKYPILWLASTIIGLVLVVAFILCLLWLYLREQKRKKLALYALANEKETLALAIEGGTTYVWKLENECFIFENVFLLSQGMPSKKINVKELVNYIHPDQWKTARACWENLKNAQKKITQLRCDFNGKGYQWWEFRYTTKQLETGGYMTAGLLLNIQGIKDREAELEAARLLAERAELKQSFLANMSHEIRTPLNSIVGFSNLLTSSEDLEVEERQDYIDTINKNSELLLKLINDILELSRIESGYMSFCNKKYLVDDLIDDAYMTHHVLITPRLEFLKESEGLLLEINVDKDRLTQVLTNFLNNAAKFTESGSIKLGYHFLSQKEEICIYVEDTGRGIPQDEQRMIFSRFYKQNEFSQGAGLGLSICQVIIEKLEGRIELRSESGKGSCFMIFLPCHLVS